MEEHVLVAPGVDEPKTLVREPLDRTFRRFTNSQKKYPRSVAQNQRVQAAPPQFHDCIELLGDFNAFAAYLIDTGDPEVSFGFGPQLTAPSATDDALGSGKWSAGFANVLFNAKSKKFQYGYL